MSLNRKYRTLTLQEKIKVIHEHEKEKRSAKELIVKFKVSKTQIYGILKNRKKIQEQWLKGTSGKVKRFCLGRVTGNEVINNAVYKWFVGARAKGRLITGRILQAEAIEVAKSFGNVNFKASNGWLDSFKSRYNIVRNRVSGAYINSEVSSIVEWKSKIRDIVEGYDPKNIFNGNETGIFYRAMPSETLVLRENKCIKGEMCEERLTIFFCANMEGEFQKPLVIGKNAFSEVFRNLNYCSLPVIWKHNEKTWMSVSIMEEWLKSFNVQMAMENRHVILFLSSAACHPKLKLTNVKLIFFPPNTISISQPMDHGIIYTLKSYYRKFLLQLLVAQVGAHLRESGDIKKNSLLDAVKWIHRAVKNVLPETVKKCFLKAGFPGQEIYSKHDEVDENLTAIDRLCREVDISIKAEDIVNFDKQLSTASDAEIQGYKTIKSVDGIHLDESKEQPSSYIIKKEIDVEEETQQELTMYNCQHVFSEDEPYQYNDTESDIPKQEEEEETHQTIKISFPEHVTFKSEPAECNETEINGERQGEDEEENQKIETCNSEYTIVKYESDDTTFIDREEKEEGETPQELKIHSYHHALSSVSDLQDFAASRDDQEFIELLHVMKDHILTCIANKPTTQLWSRGS